MKRRERIRFVLSFGDGTSFAIIELTARVLKVRRDESGSGTKIAKPNEVRICLEEVNWKEGERLLISP